MIDAPSSKIVSIALFGSGMHYAQYLPAFMRAHLNLFPQSEGWSLVVHTDAMLDREPINENTTIEWADTWGSRLLQRYFEAGLLFPSPLLEHRPKCMQMFFRVRPVFWHGADFVFCRDLDALPMPRDRAACEHFMNSGCTVHTIHDNPAHIGIMGGLCGFAAPVFKRNLGVKTFLDLLSHVEKSEWDAAGADQLILNRMIIRPGGPDLCEHRYAGWFEARVGGRPPRAPGHYACGGRSAPVPDVGESRLAPNLTAAADRLANHLGSAGYDHFAACAFWDEYGDDRVRKTLKKCEEGLSCPVIH